MSFIVLSYRLLSYLSRYLSGSYLGITWSHWWAGLRCLAWQVCSIHAVQSFTQSGTDWHQKGEIWDFWKSFFSTFWLSVLNCTQNYLQKSQIFPNCANPIHFGPYLTNLGKSVITMTSVWLANVRFVLKFDQIGAKWEKSGTCDDEMSVNIGP